MRLRRDIGLMPGVAANLVACGQDEIDAMRRRARREIFGPERSRAHPLERIGQPGRRHELTEQGALAGDAELLQRIGHPPGDALEILVASGAVPPGDALPAGLMILSALAGFCRSSSPSVLQRAA